jgi:hypothetical protein
LSQLVVLLFKQATSVAAILPLDSNYLCPLPLILCVFVLTDCLN